MGTLILNFLKGNIASLVLVAILALGAWWYDIKVTGLEEDLEISYNTVAILSNEYEKAVETAQHNADIFVDYKKTQGEIVEVLKDKYDKDIQRLLAANSILEGIRHANEEDDGTVSNVLRDTLNALRVLRENPEL